ncbi:MAG: single-stranded-DNA-specific exonuclease RecJ [Magnetococcales bacterium]|nr:single-stranded-DNA-specific exonuclease RecJ [Magnetococcales bacterium]
MSACAPCSVTGRLWRFRGLPEHGHELLAGELGLPPLFAPLLASRRLETAAAASAFLSPGLGRLVDPLGLGGMEAAVGRLAAALEGGESVAVFGDYDVDGATSTALLVRYFRALDRKLRVYIPDRLTEGYGPNPQAMALLAAEGVRLIVTVDCGTTAGESLEVAAGLGVDVIVTDHHQGIGEAPKAVAVVNPNQSGDGFPHKELAGVGVAFYLLMALNRELRNRGWFLAGRREPDLKGLLDLVALGTIADVAPLTGMNRHLVAVGLRQALRSRHPGLVALMRGLRLDGGLSVGQVGFHLAPRINAGGRLGQGDLGWSLLATDDQAEAEAIAAILEQSNKERRQIEERILGEAVARIESEGLAELRRGLVVAGRDWHPGVVGIIASRLAERYHRPTVVIGLDGGESVRGSGRSIPGVDLLAAIQACSGYLQRFGGHKVAAGVTLRAEVVDDFALAFDQAVREGNDPEVFRPFLAVDAALPLREVGPGLFEGLDRLRPFGRGNPEPVFVLEDMAVESARVLKERHLKCVLRDPRDGTSIEAIAFGVFPGPLGEGLRRAYRGVDLAGTLGLNSFQGRQSPQFLIKDLRIADVGGRMGSA